MLEQAGITVVVFGRDDDARVRSHCALRAVRVFDRLAGVQSGELHFANVDQFSLDALAFFDSAEHTASNAFAVAALSRRAEDHWHKNRSGFPLSTLSSPHHFSVSRIT